MRVRQQETPDQSRSFLRSFIDEFGDRFDEVPSERWRTNHCIAMIRLFDDPTIGTSAWFQVMGIQERWMNHAGLVNKPATSSAASSGTPDPFLPVTSSSVRLFPSHVTCIACVSRRDPQPHRYHRGCLVPQVHGEGAPPAFCFSYCSVRKSMLFYLLHGGRDVAADGRADRDRLPRRKAKCVR